MDEKTSKNPALPFIVQAHPRMLPLIPDYLKSRVADVQRLLDGIERQDFDALRTLGHNMYGSGGGYGMPPLSEIGRQIEEAALDGDLPKLRAATQALKNFLASVKLPPA